MTTAADIVNAVLEEYSSERSDIANAISDRVRREFEDRTRFLSYLSVAEHPSIYGVPGAGWLVYYTSMAVEQNLQYEEVYTEDLDFCDLADALAPVGKSP